MGTYLQLVKRLQPLLSADIAELGMSAAEGGDLETSTYVCDYLATRKRQKNLSSLTRKMKKIDYQPTPFVEEAATLSLKAGSMILQR
jgi:hypothetical protein